MVFFAPTRPPLETRPARTTAALRSSCSGKDRCKRQRLHSYPGSQDGTTASGSVSQPGGQGTQASGASTAIRGSQGRATVANPPRPSTRLIATITRHISYAQRHGIPEENRRVRGSLQKRREGFSEEILNRLVSCARGNPGWERFANPPPFPLPLLVRVPPVDRMWSYTGIPIPTGPCQSPRFALKPEAERVARKPSYPFAITGTQSDVRCQGRLVSVSMGAYILLALPCLTGIASTLSIPTRLPSLACLRDG